MYRLVLALFAALIPFNAMAQGPDRHVGVGQVLHGRFVQERHLKGFNSPLRSEGHFTLAPSHGLIWRMEKPFAVTTVITPAGLIQENNGAETMRLPSARLPFLSHLYDMLGGALAGDWHALDNDFAVTPSGNDAHWQVVLKPRVAPDPVGMPFQTITVAGGRYADSVVLEKVGGDTDTLTFFDQDLATVSLSADETAAFESAKQ